ncbi:helicase associated domain-containing protein [Streptomyces sp. NPDC001020]
MPHTSGLPVPLGRCPEVIEAQQRHVRLLRRSPAGAQAFDVARAVTNSWWDQPWPVEERAWPARLEATRPDNADPSWWKVAARDLITYPETVALARLLASRPLQQRTVAESGGHLPYRLGELPALPAKAAHELQRPWLVHHLAAVTHGPLFTWAHSCVRTRASYEATAQKALWRVHSAYRPRPLSDLLPQGPTGDGEQQGPLVIKGLRGHSLQAERAFERSLAHARVFHQQYGHLAVPKEAVPDGYPLGQWLANLRTRHTRLPAHQAAALNALYPWWKRAVEHPVAAHLAPSPHPHPNPRPPAADPRLPHHQLQPRRMAAAAAAARPRRRNMRAGAEEALAHARSYTAEHGSLASVTSATVHEGFRLGQWLANQRNYQRTGHRPLPADRAQALTAIDPWWCPPWNLKWQRSYHRARNAADSQPLRPGSGFIDLDDCLAGRWLRRQCSTYDELHDERGLRNASTRP